MSHEIQALLPYFVNFSIVLVLLFVLLRKPASKYVYQRHSHLQDAVESAAAVHKKALGQFEGAKTALSKRSADEAALLSREQAQSEQEKKEILEKGRAEASRVQQEADRLSGVEQEEASERVKEQFVSQVLRETEGLLKRGLKDADHSAILKRANASIEVGV